MCCTGANDIIINAKTDNINNHISMLRNVGFFFLLSGMSWYLDWLYCVETGYENAGACNYYKGWGNDCQQWRQYPCCPQGVEHIR